MNRINILMACTALTMAFGCDDGRDPETDGGPITIVDAGDTTGEDAGDTTGEEDAGDTGEEDAGEPDTCPDVTLDPPAGSVCAQDTLQCLMAANAGGITEEELNACIDADPMPDACLGCLNEEIIACATANGCASAAGDIDCCIADECGTDAACAEAATAEGGACVPQVNALFTCVNGLAAGTCGITQLCFAAAAP